MFANRDRRTTRRVIATMVGVFVLTAAAVALAPTSAGAAPKLDPLSLRSLCNLPKERAAFRVTNPNGESVKYTWEIANTDLSGKGNAPSGDSYLVVPQSDAGNTRIFVDGVRQDGAAQRDKTCVMRVQPVKVWTDSNGNPIDTPEVPADWRLRLDSDLETLICRWDLDANALFCRSKVDEEDKGDFKNEKPFLDVPLGGTYRVTEKRFDGDATGLGKFGPLNVAKDDLDAYLGGKDTITHVVTNVVADEAPPTSESTTTTVEDDEETTTTTTVEDDEETTTTTTVEDDEETTTTTTATTLPTGRSGSSTTFADPPEAPTTTLAPSSTTGSSTTATTTATTETTATRSLEPDDVGDQALQAEDPSAVLSESDQGSGALPVTGSSTLPVVVVGLVLLALGALGMLAARRRPTA